MGNDSAMIRPNLIPRVSAPLNLVKIIMGTIRLNKRFQNMPDGFWLKELFALSEELSVMAIINRLLRTVCYCSDLASLVDSVMSYT